MPGTAQRNVQLTQVLVAEASMLMRAAAAADSTDQVEAVAAAADPEVL